MPCDDCLNRRDFLARSALAAAAALVVEGCGDGQIGAPVRSNGGGDPLLPVGGPVTVVLANEPALATTGVIVDIGKERTLMRTGPSTFIALSRICTHQGCDIDIRGDHFECPCHLSQFTSTGAVIRGPTTGDKIGPLRQLQVTVNQAAGTVVVE